MKKTEPDYISPHQLSGCLSRDLGRLCRREGADRLSPSQPHHIAHGNGLFHRAAEIDSLERMGRIAPFLHECGLFEFRR